MCGLSAGGAAVLVGIASAQRLRTPRRRAARQTQPMRAIMIPRNDRRRPQGHAARQPPWRTYEISGVRVISGGAESATLVYGGTAYCEGDEPAFVGVMSSVYVREGDSWRLALYQQTPIPNTG